MDGPVTTYRVVVSREDPWWTAVAYGRGLPPHGVATETRTLADLEDKIRDLIVLRTDADLDMPYEKAAHSFGIDWDVSGLPDAAGKALRDYQDSKRKLADAQEQYARQAERAARELASEMHASVRDIARLMGISHQRVAQLLSGTHRALRRSTGRRTHTPSARD